MRLISLTLFSFLIFCLPVSAQKNIADEGEGILVKDTEGALPKGLWIDQPRSEITALLKSIPADAPFKSMQTIKRNLMLSTYDTSLIDNDVSIEVGDDLLTLRLIKLMQMGLWDDAYTLYTETSDDPGQNFRLAEIGVVLALFKKGIPAACLENNAFGSRFDGVFWDRIQIICDKEIDNVGVIGTQFSESPILRGIYTQPKYEVSANDLNLLTSASFLELMILIEKDVLTYDNYIFNPDIPPYLMTVFLNDPTFPDSEKPELLEYAAFYLLIPYAKSSDLRQLSASEVKNMPQNQLIIFTSNLVENNEEIPLNIIKKLQETSRLYPQNIYYLQLLREIYLNDDYPSFSQEEIRDVTSQFPTRFTKEVNILNSWLDKQAEFSNNPVKVYEKQISSPLSGDIDSQIEDWTMWLGKTTQSQLPGLSLLIVLNNNKNIGARSDQILNDLRHVGLVEQANLIARDMVVRLMRSYK
ncbi:MAG: hypothetical protein AAF549_05540 [Pseudomonadota bacterium]